MRLMGQAGDNGGRIYQKDTGELSGKTTQLITAGNISHPILWTPGCMNENFQSLERYLWTDYFGTRQIIFGNNMNTIEMHLK